jgi:hypothetical protein
MEFSVGDFAEQLMAEESKSPQKPSSPHAGFLSPAVNDGPDISEIDVPVDFVSSIVEGKDPVVEEAPVVNQVPQEEKLEEEPVKKPSSDILVEIRDLLLELKGMITEQTSVGSIGVGVQKPLGKEEEDEDEDSSMERKLKDILRKTRKKTAK